MPNVQHMSDRIKSHLARVSEKALKKEFDRIGRLHAEGKISFETKLHMASSAPIRLAFLANVS